MSQQDNLPAFDAKAFLNTLTTRPGVYRMMDGEDQVIYVGKAKNLKNRVSSYFRGSGLTPKTQALVANIRGIEVTITNTEGEALILENNLIKSLMPRYNVLLRDDKSYPYIKVSTDTAYPGLSFHRGARRGPGRFFGPYPSSGAVRETLSLLQKVFHVRQCEDSYFRNRSRPCLQYQIKRCTAPCVEYISQGDYADDLRHTLMFLRGKSSEVIDELVSRMEGASHSLEFEKAAEHRDQITRLRKVYDRQYVSGERGNLDIIALLQSGGVSCVQVFFIRDGRNLGNKAFFPKNPADYDDAAIMSAFIAQYYLEKEVPAELLVNVSPVEAELLASVLSSQAGHKVAIRAKVRGDRARWQLLAISNAQQALNVRLASKAGMRRRVEGVQEALGLAVPPARMECFDISHTMGEGTVASCVVFDIEGPKKADYRRFNISGITPGDDYAAMHQALTRRYKAIKKGEAPLPDVLIVDGGKGQLAQAENVLEELDITGVVLLGVAKGPERKAGEEALFLSATGRPFILPADSPALHLIQQIRDEAHRFAITGHRQRRARARNTSVLESIPGMGPKRRQNLLKHFGGLREVSAAGVDDLAKTPGISRSLAQTVYDTLHGDSMS